MTVSIDDLTTPVTRDEAKASIYDAMGTVGVSTTAWRPGAVVRTMVAAIAILFAACTSLMAKIAKSGFLEFAVGTWLTLVARHVYGVERLLEDPTVGRAEDEDDALLKARALKVLERRIKGPAKDAYTEAARGVKRANGTEIRVDRARSVRDNRGNVYLYLAGAGGTVTGVANDLNTDLGCIDDQLQRTVTPLGVTLHTSGATPLALAVAYKVWLLDTSGYSPAQLAARISVALAAYFAGVPIGGFKIEGSEIGRIYLDDIRAAIGSVAPKEIFHVQLVSPSNHDEQLSTDIDVPIAAAPVMGSALAVSIAESQQRVI